MSMPEWITPWRVPRCWPGETVAVLACGSSLVQEDVDRVVERWPTIAINRSYVMAPGATWLYACDPGRFWAWCGGPQRLYPAEPDAWDFAGEKVVVWSPSVAGPHVSHMRQLVEARPEVRIVRHGGHGGENHLGASDDPGVVKGNNSLFQVLSVIHHTGAARAVLLGADMRGGHFHAPWPMGEPNYKQSVAPRFASLVAPLASAGVEVVNCARGGSLITAFPQRPLEEML